MINKNCESVKKALRKIIDICVMDEKKFNRIQKITFNMKSLGDYTIADINVIFNDVKKEG